MGDWLIAFVVLLALGGMVFLVVAFYMDMQKGEKHRRQVQAEQESGRWDFGGQSVLFAVAQGIVKNCAFFSAGSSRHAGGGR